jgi:RsiW-degrading membrane proteinase PrsW (M82 family)
MDGIWVLLLLILTAALPVIIVFLWLRAIKSPVTPPWFLASLAAGMLSLLAAVLIQKFFPPPGMDRLRAVFFGVFIRIALVEEASRLISLFPLLNKSKSRLNADRSFAAVVGLTSGVGFAMIESAFYGISDIDITLLRAVTAAPLHGACGIRAGAALYEVNKHPVKALSLFTFAVFIHGAYNLIIVNPLFPSILAAPIVIAAFFASMRFTKAPDQADDNCLPPASKP